MLKKNNIRKRIFYKEVITNEKLYKTKPIASVSPIKHLTCDTFVQDKIKSFIEINQKLAANCFISQKKISF